MPEIVIVGAGVLGLSTAWVLSEKTNAKVTVVAEFGPHDPSSNSSLTDHAEYTSAWAGAHFRPAPSKDESEYEMARITRVTQAKFKKWAQSHPETSIRFVDGIEYFEDPDEITKNLGRGYTEDIENFSIIDKSELPSGVNFGTKYNTWVLNPPVYIKYLYANLRKKGVTFIKSRLDSLNGVNSLVPRNPIIVNCSGNGLLYNGGFDPKAFPIRGQTLLVRPPPNCRYISQTVTHQSKDGKWTFNVPRPLNGGVILGGTKQINDTFNGVRDSDTRELCARGEILFPELMSTDKNGRKFFDIIGINVAFRPARTGGLRIELERKESHQGRTNHVIHNYGAGGMGYELSYGSAIRVYEILQELERSKL